MRTHCNVATSHVAVPMAVRWNANGQLQGLYISVIIISIIIIIISIIIIIIIIIIISLYPTLLPSQTTRVYACCWTDTLAYIRVTPCVFLSEGFLSQGRGGYQATGAKRRVPSVNFVRIAGLTTFQIDFKNVSVPRSRVSWLRGLGSFFLSSLFFHHDI